VKPSAFDYLAPETCEEALGALAEHGDDAAVLAGGQSLIPMMNLRIAAPRVLIDVMRAPELHGIRNEGDTIEIGAGVRMTEAEHCADVPLLRRALGHVGHPAIRNRGTVCGSVAHADSAAEVPAVLLALDGQVVLRSARGQRVLAADDFFRSYYTTAREPDELVVAVRLPAGPPRVAFHEATPRLGGSTGEFATAGVAAASAAFASRSSASPIGRFERARRRCS
jgi:CO/xanthine dehydrogenase FAD-binding subunit